MFSAKKFQPLACLRYRVNSLTEGNPYACCNKHHLYLFRDLANPFLTAPEGYADALTGTGGPLYKYYRRDHLGNIREVWQAAYSVYIPSRNITQNYTATTLQRTQYYPSGLPWAANTGDNPGLQNKKYNAKEFIEMHGYDISDYGWRGLENATMRFNRVDPMADKYPSLSPYAYCANNPIILVDPDGMDPVFFGILQRTGEAKFGVSRLGESNTVGQYNVVPVYSADNKTLIAYNAGRYLANGEYRTEYQMEPSDLAGFTKNVSTYTAGANLIYCAGEPDLNLVMMTHYGMQGDYANALSSLGKSWVNAVKDPGYWATVAFSFGATAINISNANVRGIVANAEKGTGNYGVGSGNLREAYTAGEKWVGEGYRVSSNGKAWISSNGTRQFRPPTVKSKSGRYQANFQSREGNKGTWSNDGHMDIE